MEQFDTDEYEVKVYIPDSSGGSYTHYLRYASSAEEAMQIVEDDYADGSVIPVSAERVVY